MYVTVHMHITQSHSFCRHSVSGDMYPEVCDRPSDRNREWRHRVRARSGSQLQADDIPEGHQIHV